MDFYLALGCWFLLGIAIGVGTNLLYYILLKQISMVSRVQSPDTFVLYTKVCALIIVTVVSIYLK